MNVAPEFTFAAERAAVAAGAASVVDVLIRVAVAREERAARRPPLNLALAVDRSGSMRGDKLYHAKRAAAFALDQLRPQDTIAVVSFDDQVTVLAPSQLAVSRGAIRYQLDGLEAGGGTALHEAWVRAGLEVTKHLSAGAINRVLLLTDGLANRGETDTGRIVTQAGELARRGVGTSTVGLGSDFNEDLLVPMAEAGQGNAWHVTSPEDLVRIFDAELEGLLAQVGHGVRLELRAAPGARVLEVLNDFDRDADGRYRLPNLVSGSAIDVVARVAVEAGAVAAERPILSARVTWTPDAEGGRREAALEARFSVRVAPAEEVARLGPDGDVAAAAAAMLAARAEREAVRGLDAGGPHVAAASLTGALEGQLAALEARSDDPRVAERVADIRRLIEELRSGADAKDTRKRLAYESYRRSRQSRPLA